MTKDQLQAKVNELELTLNSLELNAKTVRDDLMETSKELADVNKPVITKEIVGQMREAVNQALRQIRFDSVDSYDVDFEIDYNNSLTLGSIEFNEVDEIEETVCDYIEDIFNVVDDKD